MSEAVPVLIAARNEGAYIARTLASLPRTGVEPIVIPNGCTDDTAEIAADMHARVIEGVPEGKMGALQAGLRFLGKRALGPVITLDADSWVAFPNQWISGYQAARRRLPSDRPAVVAGSLLFSGAPDPITRNVYHHLKQFVLAKKPGGEFPGANMLVHARSEATLESILAVGNRWPGEDNAIKDMVLENGGTTLKSSDLRTMVVTDGRERPSVRTRLSMSRSEWLELLLVRYALSAPPGAVPYVQGGEHEPPAVQAV